MNRMKIVLSCLILVLVMSFSISAAESLTLSDWIDRAFQENPSYQLLVKDLELAYQELEFQKTGGMDVISLTLPSITVGSNGINTGNALQLNYGWQLANDLKLTGNNSLIKDSSSSNVIEFNGSISINLNPRKLINSNKDKELEYKHQEIEYTRYTAEVKLIKDVVENYYQLIINSYQKRQALKNLELAQLKFKEKQLEFEAGIISEVDFLNQKEELELEEEKYRELDNTDRNSKRSFARLYGELLFTERLEKELKLNFQPDLLGLTTRVVDDFLKNWDLANIEEYLKNIYTYQQAIKAVENMEDTLKQTKEANDWQINIGADLNYSTSEDPVILSGTVGFSKQLYNPAKEREIKQAEINLEREKVAFQEKKNQQIFDLIDQVEKIKEMELNLVQKLKEYRTSQEEIKIFTSQYSLGFISYQQFLQAEVQLMQKEIDLIQAHSSLITEKLGLGEILGIKKLYD